MRRLTLITLAVVTLVNFLVQIPYYFHQYYVTAHLPPSPIGVVLMSGVLAWFLGGYYLLLKGKKSGYILITAFLTVEFLFYLMTQVTQLLGGHGVFLYVLHPSDPFLFLVFGIGYINFIASALLLYFLVRYRSQFIK